MSKLYLIRHGAYRRDGMSWRDERLTDPGKAQAEAAAKRLQELSPDTDTWQLLTSSAPRAVETAGIIGGLICATPVVSRSVERAGSAPHIITTNLVDFVGEAFRQAGSDYDEDTPAIVVAHLPLVACVFGDPEADIENGAVVEYDPAAWRLPGYDY